MLMYIRDDIIISKLLYYKQKIMTQDAQGRIQGFYNGVSITKKLQEYIWI